MSFSVGDRVRRRSTGEIGVIIGGPSASDYYDVSSPSGTEIVPSTDLAAATGTEEGPLDLLAAGKFSVSEEHDLYVRAKILEHAFQYDERSGLSNSRIEPKLHQIFVMLRVLAKSQARMILADEVGLGKTIEAGLLIKEL